MDSLTSATTCISDITVDIAKQEALASAFDEYLDPDQNGDCDLEEWLHGLHKLGVELNETQQRRLYTLMDIDHSGAICKDAFLFVMNGQCENEELVTLKEPLWRAVRLRNMEETMDSMTMNESMNKYILTDEQIYNVTNLICAQSNAHSHEQSESKTDDANHRPNPNNIDFNSSIPLVHRHIPRLDISDPQCTHTIHRKVDSLEISEFQCTQFIEEKVDDTVGALKCAVEKLKMYLEVQEELLSQSEQQYQEMCAQHRQVANDLQLSQNTIYRKDKELWALKGVERELKKMDLENLHDLETNMIGSLQNVRKVISKKIEKEHECMICMDRPKNTVLVPCGHCLCSSCVLRVERCPMCRAQIERTIKLR